MHVKYRNVNEQFAKMFDLFKSHGSYCDSRNGTVIRINEPVLTTIENPQERVLFHKYRDANPIFHLFEALWMLSGSDKVAPLKQFNSRIHQYSDDGERFNGAYGYRMRKHFGVDQLLEVINTLKSDPNSRQAVVQLWTSDDLKKHTLDKCCNTQLVFEIQDGKLNMTTFNRSNDAWWGYAGANAVHFTVIMEFVASALDVPMGVYNTVSTNLHLYQDLYNAKGYIQSPPDLEGDEFYGSYVGASKPMALLEGTTAGMFLDDCAKLMVVDGDYSGIRSPFINKVMIPMMQVAYARKRGETGFEHCAKIESEDWRDATSLYILNRENARKNMLINKTGDSNES